MNILQKYKIKKLIRLANKLNTGEINRDQEIRNIISPLRLILAGVVKYDRSTFLEAKKRLKILSNNPNYAGRHEKYKYE